MDGLSIAAVITALGVLLAQITSSWLQIRAANRTTEAVHEVVPVVLDNGIKLDEIHTVTNSNYAEQKELNASLRSELDTLVKQRDEAALVALAATQAALEAAQAELLRLTAAAMPDNGGAPMQVTVVSEPDHPLPVKVVAESEDPLPVKVVEPHVVQGKES